MNGRNNTIVYVPEDDCEIYENNSSRIDAADISLFRRGVV
jgi:hypothetical protein